MRVGTQIPVTAAGRRTAPLPRGRAAATPGRPARVPVGGTRSTGRDPVASAARAATRATARAAQGSTVLPGRARSARSPARAPRADGSRRSGTRPRGALARAVPVPQTAGGTGSIRTITDAGILLRLTSGSAWIFVLGVLLFGIVAVNVASLQLGAGTGQTAQRIQELREANSELRSELARRTGTDSVRRQGASAGLVVPQAGTIRFREPGRADAGRAARRLRELATATPGVAAPGIVAPETGPGPAAPPVGPSGVPEAAPQPPAPEAPPPAATAEPVTPPAPEPSPPAGGAVAPE